MTFPQAAILALLLAIFITYASERFRIELVALTGLAAAFVLGLVPIDRVFDGFANPAVITVVEILLIVKVLARTHVVERFAGIIVERCRGERTALALLCGSGAVVSVFMNNIGALALMFPVTLSVCARLGIAPGRMLMPLSFSTLLGGMCSLTGTPANLLVNDWMTAETGAGLAYFELGLVGAPVALLGLLWLAAAAPRLLGHLTESPTPAQTGPSEFLSELHVAKGSSLAGKHLIEAEKTHLLHIHDVMRGGAHVFARREDIMLAEGDVLLAEGGIGHFDALAGQAMGALKSGADRLEVVVMPDSFILGSRIEALESFADEGVTIAGLASRRRRIEGRYGDLQIGLGDVLLLTGERQALRSVATEAGLLALSTRSPSSAHPDAFRSVAIFAAGVIATATGLVPPEIAFGAVVISMALLGSLRLKPALQDMNWTIVILLACMIPLGMAVQNTGAARIIANAILLGLPTGDPIVLTALVLVLAAAMTPFVDNVSTAAVLSPIAAGLSSRAGVAIEPLLVAVAIGASLDFLTPFGHHNNTVVMGAGGYRFVDFPRLGLPLLLICLVGALAMLRIVWL